ncbi:MAG: ChbG/HpnK family deacetylase [Planctomycetes bacterium]|nr:ChbG/HpnK family deacetylase [Planctomycetota bacterium]
MPSDSTRAGSAPLLIVNADDLGMSAGVNAAIFEAHERGILTSTSLMAGGEAFDEALEGLRARPRLRCGVHLVLHDELALASHERVPHLAGADGRMRPLRPTALALLFGRIPAAEIEAEYRAQIEKVLAAGVRPTHLDSHCHLAGFPRAGAVLHRLGREYGIPCARRPELGSLADFRGSPPSRYPIALLISTLHKLTRMRLEAPLRMPARFVGLVKSGAVERDWLVGALAGLPRGRVSELMVHPGDGSGPGDPYGDHGPAMRKRELEALVSPEVRAAVERHGIELVSYAELATQ